MFSSFWCTMFVLFNLTTQWAGDLAAAVAGQPQLGVAAGGLVFRLSEVPEGCYFLNAAPLNLAGADGAPCRAILMEV